MAPRDPFENSAYCKQYYRRNAETIRARKRPQSRAYKQRVLLMRAIESARAEVQFLMSRATA